MDLPADGSNITTPPSNRFEFKQEDLENVSCDLLLTGLGFWNVRRQTSGRDL